MLNKYLVIIFIFVMGVVVGRHTADNEDIQPSDEVAMSAPAVVADVNNSTKADNHGIALSVGDANVISGEAGTNRDGAMQQDSIRRLASQSQLTINDEGYWRQVLLTADKYEQKIDAIQMLIGEEDEAGLAIGLGDVSSSIRQQALLGLNHIGTESAVRIMGQALYSDEDTETRLVLLDMLEANKHLPFVEHYLSHASKHDKSEIVRRKALQTLNQ